MRLRGANRLDQPPGFSSSPPTSTGRERWRVRALHRGITANVSPERLMLFFNQNGAIGVKKISAMVLFAVPICCAIRRSRSWTGRTGTHGSILIAMSAAAARLFNFVLQLMARYCGRVRFADSVPDLFGPIDKHNRLLPATRTAHIFSSLPLVPRAMRARTSGCGGASVWQLHRAFWNSMRRRACW
jgi:hypothetical protein